MRIRLSRDAIRDIDEIHDYIARDSRKAALRVVARIRSAIERLGDHPLLPDEAASTQARGSGW